MHCATSATAKRWLALALIAILAGVAIAILMSSDPGGGPQKIEADTPRDQSTELIEYIREHRR